MHNGRVGAWASRRKIHQRNPEKLGRETDVRQVQSIFLLHLFSPSFIIPEILHDWKVTSKSVAGEQNKTPINMDI